MSRLNTVCLKGINKIARNLNWTKVYESRTGVKVMNPLRKYPLPSEKNLLWVEAEALFLDIDWLKDEYTLVNKNILDSPHFKLMKEMDAGDKIEKTEYCKRYQQGSLDTREAGLLSKAMIDKLRNCYRKRIEEILSNESGPVKIYQIEGKFYIADGKHRAALYAYLGKKIPCVLVNDIFLLDSAYIWKYEKMKKHAEFYSRNIQFYEKVYSRYL